jgi:molecular chaperone HscB
MKLDSDDFELFGLPRRFAIDRREVDSRWRALQSEVHPDRFATEGAAAQRLAMQWAVRVNEAYRRLKDPVARAMALCELAGVHVDVHDNAAMPREFLIQQMQWREDLAEAQDPQAIKLLEGEVLARREALEEQLRVELDERDDAQAAAQTVRALMFVARFRSDVDQRLEAQEN